MPKSTIDKVLVTNVTALKAKYGIGYTGKIKPAIDALIAADKGRGLTTILVALDDKSVTKYKAKPVKSIKDAKQFKAAIDAVYKALTPAYLCILGSVDVIPHVPMVNPISSDGDPTAPSDLPYACDKPYSTKIEDFLAPTRVVGRLPDVTGAKDPTYLAGLLGTAAKAGSQPAAKYAPYLGVTAKVWHDSTGQSLQNAFGNNSALQDVPPKGPPWTGSISRLSHFFNCHGAPADPHFYGQQGSSYPVAHDATKLAGLKNGTVLAAECCYGAELYDPAKTGGQAGMCNTYLAAEAYGFFGSSTIAYGPASGNAQADLLCQFFMKHVLAGASLGEATLMARQDYIKVLSVADPSDLKTIAQFNLMGDPSLHPVEPPKAGQSVVEATSSKGMLRAARVADPEEVQAASRAMRRRHLAAVGESLAMAVGTVVTPASKKAGAPKAGKAAGNVAKVLEAELRKANAKTRGVHSFAVRQPQLAAAKGFARAAAPGEVDSVHAAVGELPQGSAPFRRLYVVVARQQAGQLLLKHLFSR